VTGVRPALAVVVALVLAGCHDATDPEIQRVIGRIDRSHTGKPVIVLPAEVPAGVGFSVLVHTVGPSTCTRPDGESVTVEGNLARIVPYDVVPIPGHSDVCLSDYAFHEHRLELALPASGTARVRVVGMRASTAANVLDSVETSVTVRP
jgi:hypothetical protein